MTVNRAAIERLVASANLGTVQGMVPLAGGRNNRICRVDTATRPLLAKAYFRHPDDPRDRMATEFAFSEFAWAIGVRCIPEPLASDPYAGLGLFEYVHGRHLEPREVSSDHVDQALDFVAALNRDRTSATHLPAASEACFRLEDHLTTVTRRVARLRSIEVTDAIHAEALAFVREEFTPLASEVLAMTRWQATRLGLIADEPLAVADRVLSPSDFGFHNALRADADGRLRFIDFEYAGWDDPAKLICDFFCQPAVPAPAVDRQRFIRAFAAASYEPARLTARVELLMPVYRVKWVCIRLNDFLQVGHQRRAFSDDAADPAGRRRTQLIQARQAVTALRQESSSIRMVA